MSTLEVKAIQAPTGYDLQMPAGNIIQVVQGSADTQVYMTTTTVFTEYTQLSTSITPKFSNSKILVTLSSSMRAWGSINQSSADHYIARNNVQVSGLYSIYTYDYGNSGVQPRILQTAVYLDSPATTSAVEYSSWMKLTSGSGCGWGAGDRASTITLMEVSA